MHPAGLSGGFYRVSKRDQLGVWGSADPNPQRISSRFTARHSRQEKNSCALYASLAWPATFTGNKSMSIKDFGSKVSGQRLGQRLGLANSSCESSPNSSHRAKICRGVL